MLACVADWSSSWWVKVPLCLPLLSHLYQYPPQNSCALSIFIALCLRVGAGRVGLGLALVLRLARRTLTMIIPEGMNLSISGISGICPDNYLRHKPFRMIWKRNAWVLSFPLGLWQWFCNTEPDLPCFFRKTQTDVENWVTTSRWQDPCCSVDG